MAAPTPSATWVAPTSGDHVCVGCRALAVFGLHGSWYCRACVPAGFLPGDRPAGANASSSPLARIPSDV